MTHLAITLCNYCASKQKKSCAYLELHARNEISQLVSLQTLASSKTEPRHFRLHDVDYYPAVSESDVPELLNLGYDYLILDIGTQDEGAFSEFLRCDRKLVLGSLSAWKAWKYEAFFQRIEDNINLREGMDYLVQTGSRQEILRFSKTHHIHMQPVPFIKNPFSIEKELFPLLGTLSSEQLFCSERLPGIRHNISRIWNPRIPFGS